MSSIPFERYDDEFRTLTEQVQDSLQKETSPQNIKYSSSLLSQCDDLIKQMAVEARGVPDASTKKELLKKVKECKAQLQALKDEHSKISSKVDRDSLGLTSSSGGGSSHDNRKERLLQTENSLNKQNDTLENARRVMADTENVALEITTELGRNRETLESAHGRVREVSGLTNRARRILQSMTRRQVQQKLAMYAVSGFIVIVFLIILWNLR
mmetsp:Transcript_1774/g.2392  ORF Transcript_1774/g.2392 Transcript_1774/m.2392 type:complete len:212 (+) Transcript_1774:162-797(+)